ncbi:MAG TPA: hypothetical protein VMT88_02310 [Actinomycetes bacterium]|nr:hypothetical protein [Actinomycetes bacterium]
MTERPNEEPERWSGGSEDLLHGTVVFLMLDVAVFASVRAVRCSMPHSWISRFFDLQK